MIKTFIIAGLASLSMGASPVPQAAPQVSAPNVAICMAGLTMAWGGGAPLLSLSAAPGRCACPDGCAASMFRLDIAGLTFRV